MLMQLDDEDLPLDPTMNMTMFIRGTPVAQGMLWVGTRRCVAT